MKRKLLFLATYDMTVPGTGSSVRGAFFLRHLAESYDVHLLYMEGFGHAPARSGLAMASSVPTGVVGVDRIPYSDKGFFIFEPRLLEAAERIIRSEGIDLIFASFGSSCLYARMAGRRHGIPYIYDSHNVEYLRYLDFGREDWRRYPLIPYVYWWESTGCRDAALTVAITEEDALIFRRWSDSIMTLPGGFDESVCNPYYPDPPSESPIVLFVGNFNNPGNRQAAFIACERIVESVVRARPGVRFVFAGANPPDEIVMEGVEFSGFVEDLAPLWRQAWLVMVPVVEGGGMRIKTIEALAYGKPVVATAKGLEGIPEGLDGVWREEIDAFPSRIVQVLDAGPKVYRERFDAVSRLFGNKALYEQLRGRIEEKTF